MSVLIKGMKMPEKCGSCDLFHVESPMHCTVVKGHKTVGAPYGMPRPDWCPLVEIPEHGRLIDADALIEFCAERWIPLNIDAVNMQPTIQPEKAQLSQEGATSDLISRQAAIDALQKCRKHCIDPFDSYHIDIQDAENQLSKVPTIQPEPQEGHWIEGGIYRDVIECNCSECGQLMTTAATVRMNFCPNCGAKMSNQNKIKGERQK